MPVPSGSGSGPTTSVPANFFKAYQDAEQRAMSGVVTMTRVRPLPAVSVVRALDLTGTVAMSLMPGTYRLLAQLETADGSAVFDVIDSVEVNDAY